MDFTGFDFNDAKQRQKANEQLKSFVGSATGANADDVIRGFSGYESIGRAGGSQDESTFKSNIWSALNPGQSGWENGNFTDAYKNFDIAPFKGSYDAWSSYNSGNMAATQSAIKQVELQKKNLPVAQGGYKQPSQWTSEQESTLLNSIGYSGAPSEAVAYFNQNPAKYQQYLTSRKAADPTFSYDLDLNPNVGGAQSISPEINKYLGSMIGYYGDVGGGQLGSGMQGVDYLNYVTPEMRENYINTRKIFEPDYAWGGGQTATPQSTAPVSPPAPAPAYQRPAAAALPAGLQWLKDYTDQQKRSAIATQGLYGTGADRSANDYYLNLLQQSVVNDFGGVNEDGLDNLLPIEGSYLQYLNIPYGSGDEFLTGLGRYYAQ